MKVFLAVACAFLFACKSPSAVSTEHSAFHYEINKHTQVSNGAVVCAHPLAAKVGVDIMKKGGNAFDAAIATQFALAVVYPGAGNLGGGGFMVARKSNGETTSLDFRETAPGSAHRDMYLDSNGNVIPGKSIRGPGASGIPGTVAGCFEILKLAKLPVEQLLEPAIRLAKNGFSITKAEAAALNGLEADFAKYNSFITAFQKSIPWKEGDTLIQADLAATLTRIAREGLKGFYEGETAKLIVKQMNVSGGKISLEDLKNYRAKWRDPHRFMYKGHEIVTMGLPSSGGVILQQVLTMVSARKLDSFAQNSAGAVQLMVEAERRAYADRAQYLGDADFFGVPVKALVSKPYIEQRMRDFKPGVAGSSATVKAGIPPVESEETTHISIIDKEGNAVAVTTTLNDSYGCRTVVEGAGFILNNEMDDFSVKPGVPNLYGAIGGEANAIAPGKRMLSSMSPTIVLKNNKPFFVVGTPGGTTIPTSVFQSIVNIIDFKLSAEEAVYRPKFHHQWMPDEIFVEPDFPDSVVSALETMGYRIAERGHIGRTELISVNENGSFDAVADVRGDDHAEGY